MAHFAELIDGIVAVVVELPQVLVERAVLGQVVAVVEKDQPLMVELGDLELGEELGLLQEQED